MLELLAKLRSSAPQSASVSAEPHAHAEAQEILDILEYEVIPLYYDRNRQGYSPGWINKVKASMKSLSPAMVAWPR